MRLATFNILSGRSPTDGRVDLDRFREAIKALDADVLALQEVDRAQPRSRGADLTDLAAEAMGAQDWRFVPAITGTPGVQWAPAADDVAPDVPAYGVALLSRYPVHTWDTLRLPPLPVRLPLLVPGPQKVMLVREEPRVAVIAAVDTPDGPLTVASTHLAFVPGWNFRQLDLIRKALGGVAGPVVIAGDLNLPGGLPTALRGYHRLARAATYPLDNPRVQLDHLLARGPIRAAGTPESRAMPVSDHRALLVDVRLG
jgi:endonuclease/exonuclease/phosphatase family metal-dependent hydrolase